uniref:RxLR effector protein n=1 Tax=Peronospora matthiolae TaxID=2874970 RepID=A0AAV1T4J8_9STRA
MLSANKALALLAALLLSSGSVPLTFGHSGAVTPTQEAAPQAKEKELVRATTSFVDGRDGERTEDERISLEELIRFEGIADEVKADVMKFLPIFKSYNERNKEALDVYSKMKKLESMSKRKAFAYSELYDVYLNNRRAFEAQGR